MKPPQYGGVPRKSARFGHFQAPGGGARHWQVGLQPAQSELSVKIAGVGNPVTTLAAACWALAVRWRPEALPQLKARGPGLCRADASGMAARGCSCCAVARGAQRCLPATRALADRDPAGGRVGTIARSQRHAGRTLRPTCGKSWSQAIAPLAGARLIALVSPRDQACGILRDDRGATRFVSGRAIA